MIGKSIGKALAKRIADDQRAMQAIGKPDPQKLLADLPNDHGVSLPYLRELLFAAKTPRSVNIIIQYLRSDAATNLTVWQRARIIHECFDRIDLLHTVQSLLH